MSEQDERERYNEEKRMEADAREQEQENAPPASPAVERCPNCGTPTSAAHPNTCAPAPATPAGGEEPVAWQLLDVVDGSVLLTTDDRDEVENAERKCGGTIRPLYARSWPAPGLSKEERAFFEAARDGVRLWRVSAAPIGCVPSHEMSNAYSAMLAAAPRTGASEKEGT